MAVKPASRGHALIHTLRHLYYRVLGGISDVTLLSDSTGFGLYDKVVLDQIRQINDPYPYFRGLICELGYKIKTIQFIQPRRLRGVTKNNFYTLYDIAMLAMVSHSKVPIRIVAFLGFILGFFSMLTGVIFLILKLMFWYYFPVGDLAHRHRRFFSVRDPAVLHRHHRRVYRLHSYLCAAQASRGREGKN